MNVKATKIALIYALFGNNSKKRSVEAYGTDASRNETKYANKFGNHKNITKMLSEKYSDIIQIS